jgi:hypothetical protein
MQSHYPETSTPPLVAFDPVSAFWVAWLQGAQMTGAALTAWMGMLRLAQPSAVTINFPFANGFTQDIDPRTNWGWIGATDRPDLEAEILRHGASYGRQLGRIMDLLLDIAENNPDADPDKLAALREIGDRIAKIKRDHDGH